MSAMEILDLLRTASQSALGLLGLLVAGLAILAFFSRRDERKTALVAFLLGAASFSAAAIRALPLDDGVTQTGGSVVIDIDRTNDYHHGIPGNLFVDARHMIRDSGRGGMWSSAGGVHPYYVIWRIQPPHAGRYELRVRYAAEESRPMEVRLDDRTLFTGLARTTRSWLEPEWFLEGTVELHEGANSLSFFSLKRPPNIDAVRLTYKASR